MVAIFLSIIFIPFSALLFYGNYSAQNLKSINFRYAIFIFILLLIITGLRHVDIGNDSLAYKYIFEEFDITQNFWNIEGRYEFGFQYFSKFIKIFISDEIVWFFVISSIIIQGLCVRFFYVNSKILWLSVFLFITFRYFFFTLSAVRQGIALGICLYSYEFLRKERINKFLIYVFLAFSFHYSALIFLVLLVFRKLKFSKKKVFVFTALSLILLTVMSSLIGVLSQYMSYGANYFALGTSDDISTRFGAILIAIFTLIVLLFSFFFKYDTYSNSDFSARIELWAVLFSFLIGVLTIKFGILMRFTYYFGIFSVILVPNVISTIQQKKTRQTMILFWTIFSLIYIMTILYYRPEWYMIYPYKFFWE